MSMDRASLPLNMVFAAYLLCSVFGSGCAKTKSAESSDSSDMKTGSEQSISSILQYMQIDSIVAEQGGGSGGAETGLPAFNSAPSAGSAARIKFYGVRQSTEAAMEQKKETNEIKSESARKALEESPAIAETVKAGGEAGKSIMGMIAAIIAMALVWRLAPRGKA
jgi:hypothetical protein